MGQPVAVTEKPSVTPGVVRFELNRSLTGMGHERYASIAQATGATPGAVLARRMFETGRVGAVHVYANVVTVDLLKGFQSDGLADLVRDLYTYYRPGVEPPSVESLMAAVEAPEAAAPSAGGDGGDAALSAAASRVPAHLLERSRLARQRLTGK
ncbi:MAG: hypothetical protein RL219_1065 [Actinomycetota bacterium]